MILAGTERAYKSWYITGLKFSFVHNRLKLDPSNALGRDFNDSEKISKLSRICIEATEQ